MAAASPRLLPSQRYGAGRGLPSAPAERRDVGRGAGSSQVMAAGLRRGEGGDSDAVFLAPRRLYSGYRGVAAVLWALL